MDDDAINPADEVSELAEALRQSENRFRALMNSIVDGLVIIDEAGIVRNFNPAAERMFGYTEQEMIGRSVNTLMPASYAAEHDGYLLRYLETGEARIIGIGREVAGLRKRGDEFPMDLSVSEMQVRGKRFFIGTVRDISARKEIEAELRQAHKMEALGQLTGGVAHDFNNLLAVLMMDLEMLEEMTEGNEEMSELVSEAREVAHTGAELTQRLLAFSRRQALQPQVIDMNALVSGMASMLRRTLGESVEIDIVGPGNLWRTLADPGQVENALLNLAINARDAMPRGGRLTIETDNEVLDEAFAQQHPGVAAGEYVLLSVTDTGSGMTEEVMGRAFDPFFSTKEAGSGSGLGLSMVYGFVKQSGGHVSIFSEVDRGTTIRIYLPRAVGDGIAPARPSPRSATGNETILLVEDHPQLRRRTFRVLEELGYCVIEAANGDEALKVVENRDDIALLFTDLVMPGNLGGASLAEAARLVRPRLKVLFTTGYAERSASRSGFLEHGDALLNKPYTRAELAAKVRALLDSGA